MRSLVIGRFQPFHLGHVKMLEYVAQKSEFLIIGLGSCNSSTSLENPFTAEERQEMIKSSLALEIPYEIRRVPDFGDNAKWVDWILQNIVFDAVWTNSENERSIFLQAGLKVLGIPLFDRASFSATEVRMRMLHGHDWANLLPEGTIKVIDTLDGVRRLKKLANR